MNSLKGNFRSDESFLEFYTQNNVDNFHYNSYPWSFPIKIISQNYFPQTTSEQFRCFYACFFDKQTLPRISILYLCVYSEKKIVNKIKQVYCGKTSLRWSHEFFSWEKNFTQLFFCLLSFEFSVELQLKRWQYQQV